ncbi:ABC transporter ATP-binding protein [Sandaracinus amylolyticus]|uniref:ABC transporter ATP-binding protein n=1 Tax=Sandaracinus amylolyticus TaxID=927083 RepID=UPI001F1D3729|nr:ABC transporter ATP-binding protein [Sandaracinus amylolyticus]UJR80210.1 Dipeptide ABC transporter ATP-binding protein DppD [Sandaracinus amylolyticus]
MAEPLLVVEDLVTVFETDEGPLRAVDGVSFEVPKGGTLALVGESGCGKSVTSLSIMGLVPEPGHVASGRILFGGRDLAKMDERALRALRGRRISMIFQDPSSSLNPVYTVGRQIEETLRAHLGMSARAARARAIELLAKVGIPAPAERVDAYPHQLSGGMRQRVMIAIALACEPELLIADEPTTALDVTIQAQILELLGTLQRETGTSVILITHDLGVVAELADEVVVMYAGRVVERAERSALFASPRHPYTRGLLRSVPSNAAVSRAARLPTIRGVVPDLRALPAGCRFQDRCEHAAPACREADPALVALTMGAAPGALTSHRVACVRSSELASGGLAAQSQETGVV